MASQIIVEKAIHYKSSIEIADIFHAELPSITFISSFWKAIWRIDRLLHLTWRVFYEDREQIMGWPFF